MHIRAKLPWLAGMVLLLVVIGAAGLMIGRQVQGSYHYRAALEAIERRDFQRAQSHFSEYLDLRPDDLPVRLLAAQTARRQGDFAEANRHLQLHKQKKGPQQERDLEEKLLAVQQGDLTDALLLLSFCAANSDEPSTPLVLEAVIEGVLNQLLPLYALEAKLRKVVGASDMALLQRGIDQWLGQCAGDADRVQGLVWRGRLHRIANEVPEAIRDFRTALEMDPNHFQARLQLALIVFEPAPEETVAHLRLLRRRDPENPRLARLLAGVLHIQGQLQEAEQILDELLAANPDNASTLLERGRVALARQGPKQAEPWLRRAVKLAPDNPEVNFALSQCLQQMGNEQEANDFRERFKRLDAERKIRFEKQLENREHSSSP